MVNKYLGVLGIDRNHSKTLRLLFIAICRKVGNVEYKSSAAKKDWDRCKRLLVWNDEFLKERLVRPGKAPSCSLDFRSAGSQKG